jgi:cell division septal protein FtsQ
LREFSGRFHIEDQHLVVENFKGKMGNSDFAERLQRFATVYRGELAERAGEVKRVDLRYESGLAVAFREPELPAGEEPAAQLAGIVND